MVGLWQCSSTFFVPVAPKKSCRSLYPRHIFKLIAKTFPLRFKTVAKDVIFQHIINLDLLNSYIIKNILVGL